MKPMTGVPRRGTRALCLAGGACIVAAFLFGFHAYGSQPVAVETRADVIFIDTLARFGPLQRQPVAFGHDLHTKALLRDTDTDCTLCHMVDEHGSLSLLFKRLQETDAQGLLDLYHDNCMGCHARLREAGAETGPVTCGGCHPRKARVLSSISPAGFDLSMHYRHIELCEDNCESCHHQYDEAKKTLYYAKGREVSCRDCHRDAPEENRLSMREASHQACIGCHRGYSTSVEEEQAPITCGGCHSAERQRRTQAAERVARLQRGQPDVVLLPSAREDLAASRMNTVPFDHETHEGAVTTCRACHHETLKACRECHLLKPDEGAKGVSLEKAMHDVTSTHSCIGCHKETTTRNGCRGCHAFMEQGRVGTGVCQRCHYGPSAGTIRPGGSPRPVRQIAMSSFRREDIPETVVIGGPATVFEPAAFPHRRVVDALNTQTAQSKLATHFHGTPDTTCLGCHHHTPVGQLPPRCGTCHGKPFDQMNLFMPGLLGAYHRQCIGCHEQMAIEPISSCTGCHEKKRETAAR